MTATPTILAIVIGWIGEPSQPKCDKTSPPITWPASSVIITGPAPTWGISQAMAKTSEAPRMPAVSNARMDLLQGLERTALPPGQADCHGAQRSDAPEERVADANVAYRAAHFPIHRQMDSQHHPQKYREYVQMHFHLAFSKSISTYVSSSLCGG